MWVKLRELTGQATAQLEAGWINSDHGELSKSSTLSRRPKRWPSLPGRCGVARLPRSSCCVPLPRVGHAALVLATERSYHFLPSSSVK